MEPGHGEYSEDGRNDAGEHVSGGTAAPSPPTTPTEQPAFPTLQELRDLPRRILPEETYTHLKNAGREAFMALYSLWRSIDSARQGQSGNNKVRKHIDVE